MSFTPDVPTTEEVIAAVLSSSLPPLPPQEQRLGSALVSWWETDPGQVYVHAEGGTPDDRHYAQTLVGVQLQGHGYKRTQFDLDLPTVRVSSWVDLMAKAKRLIQSGQVHILRNGFNYIVGHVIGDHGEYDTEISRDDPNSRAITSWQCSCLAPGSKIIMADGTVKAIELVAIGDVVLSATGRPQRVLNTSVREYSGKLIGLRPTGFTEQIWLTDDHKLFTADYEPKEARNWTANDFSYYPEPVVDEWTDDIDVLAWVGSERYISHESRVYKRNRSYSDRRQPVARRPKTPYSLRYSSLPCVIPVDEDFVRLAGLYVAEGLTTKRGETRWSFDDDGSEDHLVEHVQKTVESYGLKWRMENDATSTIVTVDSLPFSEIFYLLFGKGERDKYIDERILALPLPLLKVFFEAWIDGDGHRGNMNVRDSISTSSVDLAMQIRYIQARLGHETVHRVKEDNSSPLVPGGREINHVSWRSSGSRGQGKTFFAIDQVYQKMTDPETRDYSGLVYNIEVEGEHSYVIYPGIASANCPWDQYAWQRTRKWKKFEGRPCAHVLSLYWKALATPMDEQLTEEQAAALGTGQALPAPAVPEHPPEIEKDIMQGERHQDHIHGPDTHNFGLPRSFGPEGDIIQGDQTQMNLPPDAIGGPAQSPLAPPPQGPMPPGILPPFPGEQMEMQWAGPGTTPGGGQSPPGAYSVPGAKPPNQPANPLQNPGTYSKTAMGEWGPDGALVEEPVEKLYHAAPKEHREAIERDGLKAGGDPDVDPQPAVFMTWEHPSNTTDPAFWHPGKDDVYEVDVRGLPIHYDPWGEDHDEDYLADLGGSFYHPGDIPPERVRRLDWDPQQKWYQGDAEFSPVPGMNYGQDNPAFDPRKRAKTVADFQAPQVVKLKKDVVGVAEGPVQGQNGDGEYREIPAVKPNGQPQLAEVLSQDPTTGWVEVIIPLDASGPGEPFHVRSYLEASDIEPASETNAFIRRHR